MSKIFDCQAKLVSLLVSDPFFTDHTPDPAVALVPVISQRVGDIQTEIASALQRAGVGVIVMLPLVTLPENNLPDLTIGLNFAIVVTENPLLNGTGKPAEAIVEKILQLAHWKPNGIDPGESRSSLFIIDHTAARHMPPPSGTPAILAYTIRINTEISL